MLLLVMSLFAVRWQRSPGAMVRQPGTDMSPEGGESDAKLQLSVDKFGTVIFVVTI